MVPDGVIPEGCDDYFASLPRSMADLFSNATDIGSFIAILFSNFWLLFTPWW